MNYINSVVLKLGFTVETPESFINGLRSGPTPTHSDLIGLEYSLGIRGFKSSPGDFFEVQKSLRTTNNLLKVTDLRWQKSWLC